jgi:hypothetical protein
LSYLKEQQARETLRTIVLKVMADNRLDALVYASADREPTTLSATAQRVRAGRNPQPTHGQKRLTLCPSGINLGHARK